MSQAVAPKRRRFLLAAVGGAGAVALGIQGCAAAIFPFIPDHYTFSQTQVQDAVQRKFPFQRTASQIFDVTLEEALKLYAEPKRRGRQGAAAPPLRELGSDPASGQPMVIKDGRFGPYVTDGETNASLRKGDDVLSITDARASELLADRRARGPVKKTTKKAPAKKAAAKKTAKKSPAKKAAKRS